MKILIMGNVFNPLEFDNYKSGMETFTINTYKALVHSGHDVYLSGPSDSVIKDRFIPWPAASKYSKLLYDPTIKYFNPTENYHKYLTDIKSLNPDLILSSTGSIRALRYIASLDYPTIYFAHSYIIWKYDSLFYKYILDIKSKHSNFKVAAVSSFVKDNINSVLSDVVDCTIVPSYVPVSTDISDSRYSNSVIYTGRISRDKEIENLVNIFKNTEFNLTIIGEPSKFPIIESKWFSDIILPIINSSSNINIITSNISHELLYKELSRHSVYVSPAVGESIGYSSLEALSVGTPVISHYKKIRSGLCDFIEDGFNGYNIDSYRNRFTSIKDKFLHAAYLCNKLDNSKIKEDFSIKYSAKKYSNSIINLADKLFSINIARENIPVDTRGMGAISAS